jgi:hypothetical protein
MERGHRPVGEQAIAKMQIPSNAAVLMLVADLAGLHA